MLVISLAGWQSGTGSWSHLSNQEQKKPFIADIVKDSRKQIKKQKSSVIFGFIMTIIVSLVPLHFLCYGASHSVLILLSGFDYLLFSLLNNPLNWSMSGMLALTVFLFAILLPKRKVSQRKPMTTARIAEIGVVTAAVAVVYLTTAWIIDAILPYVGCVGRTIAVAVFLSGVRHYKWWELFLITTLSLLITLVIIPCPINTIAIPISMAFVLVYGLLRRHTPPWISITLGTFMAYMVMMASVAFINPDRFWENFVAALSLSWILLIIIPLIIWWRTRKNAEVNCQGCDKDCDRFSMGKN